MKINLEGLTFTDDPVEPPSDSERVEPIPNERMESINKIEGMLDGLVTKRAKENVHGLDEKRAREWQESADRYFRRHDLRIAWAWLRHHKSQRDTHQKLADEHEAKRRFLAKRLDA